jgi:predicted CXXCH cytochrome family protein
MNRRIQFKVFIWCACFLGIIWGTVSVADAGSCVTSECHSGVTQHETVHSPVKEGNCLGCHKQKTAVHPAKKGQPSFVLIADGAKLCYKCHDKGKGWVMHEPVREGDCLSCHRPHGSAGPFLLDVGENQRSLCFECHDSEPFEQEFVHGPVSLGVCTYCHTPHKTTQRGLLKDKPQELCLGCHADFAKGMKDAKIVHSAVSKQTCIACHNPHASAEKGLLKYKSERLCFQCHTDIDRKFRLSKTKHTALYKDAKCGNCHLVHFAEYESLLFKEEMELCIGCHNKDDKTKSDALRNIQKELEGKNKKLHGPLKEKKCSLCHDPHGGEHAKLIKGAYPGTFYAPYRSGIYDFCFSCHDGNMLKSEYTTKDTSFRNGDQNLHFLHVVNDRKGRSCNSCHESHASDGQKLISKKGASFGEWRVPIRFEMTDTGGSCVPGCHSMVAYDRKKSIDYYEKEKKH